MEHETEATESSIGTDHGSVLSEEMIAVFIGQMNDQLRSWYGGNTTTVDGCAVACSAGTETVADNDGSYTGCSHATIRFSSLLKRLGEIFDTEAIGAILIDTHGINAANSGSDRRSRRRSVSEPAIRTIARVTTVGDHGSLPHAFRQTVNMSDGQQGVVSSITNRSKDSDRYSSDTTDESQKKRCIHQEK